jgi:hypothetical protein
MFGAPVKAPEFKDYEVEIANAQQQWEEKQRTDKAAASSGDDPKTETHVRGWRSLKPNRAPN